jgi:hypothetical protein
VVGETPESDQLGCWSFWELVNQSPPGPDQGAYIRKSTRFSTHDPSSKLTFPSLTPESEWTPLPPDVFRGNDFWRPDILRVADIFKANQINTLPEGSAAILQNYSLPKPELLPENHVGCLGNTYFMLEQGDRWGIRDEFREGQGVWNSVGKHMRFQPGIQELRDLYIKQIFGLKYRDNIPGVSILLLYRSPFE